MTIKDKIVELTKKHNFLQKMFINFFENNNDSYEYIENTFNKITKYKEIVKNYNIDVLSFKTLELLNDEVTKSIQDSQSKTMAKKLLSKKSQILLSKDAYFLLGILLNNGISESQIRDEFTKKIAAHKDINSLNFKELLRTYVENKTSSSIEKIKEKAKNYRTNVIFEKENILILSINDYRACKELGSQSWCISYSESTFHDYRNKKLNNLNEVDSNDIVFNDDNSIHNAIGNRFYFVYDFNYEIGDKRRLLGLTISPSEDVIYSHYMNDNVAEYENVAKYKKILSTEIIKNDFLWHLEKYVTSSKLEQLKLAMIFNVNYTSLLIDDVDSFEIDLLWYIKKPTYLTKEIFEKLYEKIDKTKMYKFCMYSPSTKGINKLILSRNFLNFDEEKVITLCNLFDSISFASLIASFTANNSKSYSDKERNQKQRNIIYRNLLHYVDKINVVNFSSNTAIFQNIAKYNPEKIPSIISGMDEFEIRDLFKATNIASLVKVLIEGINPFESLINKMKEHDILDKSLEIKKCLNMKSVISSIYNLNDKQLSMFFNCKLFSKHFDHEMWKKVKYYKNMNKFQISIEAIENNEKLKTTLINNGASTVVIKSHNFSIRLLELYIKDVEFSKWYDENHFDLKFDNIKLCEYITSKNEVFLIKLFSSNLFNNFMGEEILYNLFKETSWHKTKSKLLIKCLINSTCTVEQPLFDFGFSFNSDGIMSYLKNKKVDFKKLMENSKVKELKFLNTYLMDT
jgi:hypothetical protein